MAKPTTDLQRLSSDNQRRPAGAIKDAFNSGEKGKETIIAKLIKTLYGITTSFKNQKSGEQKVEVDKFQEHSRGDIRNRPVGGIKDAFNNGEKGKQTIIAKFIEAWYGITKSFNNQKNGKQQVRVDNIGGHLRGDIRNRPAGGIEDAFNNGEEGQQTIIAKFIEAWYGITNSFNNQRNGKQWVQVGKIGEHSPGDIRNRPAGVIKDPPNNGEKGKQTIIAEFIEAWYWITKSFNNQKNGEQQVEVGKIGEHSPGDIRNRPAGVINKSFNNSGENQVISVDSIRSSSGINNRYNKKLANKK